MKNPEYNPKDYQFLKAQNEGTPCESCRSTSGHYFHCATINPSIASEVAQLESLGKLQDDRSELAVDSYGFTEADKIAAHGLGVQL
jgi:hypothetical protein